MLLFCIFRTEDETKRLAGWVHASEKDVYLWYDSLQFENNTKNYLLPVIKMPDEHLDKNQSQILRINHADLNTTDLKDCHSWMLKCF